MNIFELAQTLPNGLHDAEVTELSISYRDRVFRIQVIVWIGDVEAPPEAREEYRPATIELTDLEYCILDRPDPKYLGRRQGVITIDLAEPDPAVGLPGNGPACRLWVAEWNGFIHLRGGEATITWTGPSLFRRHGA